MAKKFLTPTEEEQKQPDIPELTGLLGPFKYGFRNRNIILNSSLLIEKTTSSYIVNLLGMKIKQKKLTTKIKSNG